jgi:hypothetical protein
MRLVDHLADVRLASELLPPREQPGRLIAPYAVERTGGVGVLIQLHPKILDERQQTVGVRRLLRVL